MDQAQQQIFVSVLKLQCTSLQSNSLFYEIKSRHYGAFFICRFALVEKCSLDTSIIGKFFSTSELCLISLHLIFCYRKIRENQKNQKGVVLWFTGLSASGKTSIANALETLLTKNNNHSYILDGDVFERD